MDFEMGVKFNDEAGSDFRLDKQLRLGFIRKVYGILSIQILITVIFVMISMSSTAFAKFQNESSGIFMLCLILTCVLPCVITCCRSTMSTVPKNYIILFLFTFAESYIVSYICSVSDPKLVFMAACMTAAITIAVTIYAVTTETDFTLQGGLFFILSASLLMLTVFSLFTSNKFLHILICSLGVILFGLYIIYDTQLIMGKGELKLEIDDYILGAFMLYVDIVNLFLYLLELLKTLQNES